MFDLTYNWYCEEREDSPLYFGWNFSFTRHKEGVGSFGRLDVFQVKPTKKQLRKLKNKLYKESSKIFKEWEQCSGID